MIGETSHLTHVTQIPLVMPRSTEAPKTQLNKMQSKRPNSGPESQSAAKQLGRVLRVLVEGDRTRPRRRGAITCSATMLKQHCAFLRAVIFVALSLITFSTGSFWGVYAVSLPIVVPLASSMDVPMPLVLGAVISAGAFGSHACFYGDASVLASSSSGCNLLAHVKTQLPYALLAAAISALGFLALGIFL